MTDVEHELVVENGQLRAELARVRQIAVDALAAAIKAQDVAHGRHDEWLDAAVRHVDETDASNETGA